MNNTPTTTRTVEEMVKEFCRLGSEHDLDALLALLAPEFGGKSTGIPGFQVATKETLAQIFEHGWAAFDLKWEPFNIISKGDMALAEIVESGTFKAPWVAPRVTVEPTHRSYSMPNAVFFRINSQGLIVEMRTYSDHLEWLHLIGVDPNVMAPPPAQ
jgi:ketosteroid isomerase-like protein